MFPVFIPFLSSTYSTLSFSVLFAFLSQFFPFLILTFVVFLIVDFYVSFCKVSIDFLRIVFIFSVDGSSSFRVSNLLLILFFLKGVANFSNTLKV